VHAALSQNTDVIVYGGTPHGRANLFSKIRHGLIPGEVWPVFTFHWRDNPDKNYALEVAALNGAGTEIIYPWYLFEKAKSVDVALFEQEVDISYDAETKNQVILGAWVQAARQLRLQPSLPRGAGLDVSDTGDDRTVYASHAGPVVKRVSQIDPAEAPQVAHEYALIDQVGTFQYDRNGVGASIAATLGRRTDLPYTIRGVFNGERPSTTVYDDSPTPANLRFANFAAECWWRLRLRFQKTWERLEQGIPHPDEDCISLADLPSGDDLNTLIAELSQATYHRAGTSDKIAINKKGDGTTSPNFAEALMYTFAPAFTVPQPDYGAAAVISPGLFLPGMDDPY